MTHYKYGISGLLPQISFCGETSVRFFLRLQECLLCLVPSLDGTACTLQFFSIFTFFVREEVKEMMNKRKTGSETLAAFEEHLNEVTFSNLRKQVAFCNAFNSSFAKWCKPGDGISVLVPQISFHGETFGGVAKCWLFFFPDKLSMAKGLEKNLKFILSIGQTALKFSSPTAIAYFVKH